jgi:hypothetical protein
MAAFYLCGGVVAADAVNGPAEFAVAKRGIAAGTSVDRASVADAGTPLKQAALL